MAEKSFFWDEGGGGDASPNTEAEFASFIAAIAGISSDNEGVLANALSGLTPSPTGGGTTVTTASGWAIVDGHPYRNTSAIVTTPATPSGGTTGERIVIRTDWVAQTTRLVELTSADGTATIPALTQVAGVTWEIPICSYQMTTGGAVINFVDEREFGHSPAREGAFSLYDLITSPYELIAFSEFFTLPQDTVDISDLGIRKTGAGAVNAGSSGTSTARIVLTTSQNAYLHSGLAGCFPNRNPRMRVVFGTDSTTTPANNNFTLFGFVSAVGTNSSPNGAYLRKGSGDANWFFVTDQGGEVTTNLGFANWGNGDVVEILTSDDGLTWSVLINNTIAVQHTTGLPTPTTGLQWTFNAEASGGGNYNTQAIDALTVIQQRL